MTKLNTQPSIGVTVFMTENRKSAHTFYTKKSARHFAKQMCNNRNVISIMMKEPGQPVTNLYRASDR